MKKTTSKNDRFGIDKRKIREKVNSILKWIDAQKDSLEIDVEGLRKRCKPILNLINNDTGCGREEEALRNELQALLTCGDPYSAFNRAFERTRPMLLKVPSLRRLWPLARKYNKYVDGLEGDIPPVLDRLRKEMNRDSHVFSSESKKDDDQPITLQDELLGEDQWAEDARRWLLSRDKDKSRMGSEWDEFMGALDARDFLKFRSYPIGEHPVIALAYIEHLCERFQPWKLIGERPSSHVFRTENMHSMHACLKRLVENLIADLPNIKSWGDYAVEGLNIMNLSVSLATEEWRKDSNLSRTKVAECVHELLVGRGKNCSYLSIYKWIEGVDPRTKAEKKAAQHQRGRKQRKYAGPK